jgi:phage-related minor tail protein
MNSVTTTKRDMAHEADKAKEAASGMADKAKEAASGVADKAKEMASQAGQAVSNAATTVGHKAEDAVGSAGRGMESLGEKIREKGPDHGVLGKATESVACALEKGGKYLEEKKISGMADDLTDLIKRNPIPALFIGFGLGFLLARTFRS